MEIINYKEIRSTFAARLLKNFPACGVRYKNFGKSSLMLVHPDLKNQIIFMQKKRAAEIKGDYLYISEIPRPVINAMKIKLPIMAS
jgi:hypothetical protein|tara:strand:+ start:38 stop:295 length:258 start_codon:yes stop_codon:yes gene_type:complete